MCVCKLKSAFWCVVTHHVRNVHFNLWRNVSCSWNISYFWIISLQIPFLCVCVNWNLLFGALSPTMCVTCILIFDVTLAVVETFPISGSSHYRYLSRGNATDFIIFLGVVESSINFWIIPPHSRNKKCSVISCFFFPFLHVKDNNIQQVSQRWHVHVHGVYRRTLLVQFPFSFFSMRFVSVHGVHP